METLKPCPFCGGETKEYEHRDVGFIVQCRRCGIWNAGYSPSWSHITEDEFHGFVTKDDAIAAWNTRVERMCQMALAEPPDVFAGWYRCSTCGDVYPPCNPIIVKWALQYCPRCGAKVVS